MNGSARSPTAAFTDRPGFLQLHPPTLITRAQPHPRRAGATPESCMFCELPLPSPARQAGGCRRGPLAPHLQHRDTPSGQGTRSWAALCHVSGLPAASAVASQPCEKKATGRLWLRAKAIRQLIKIKDDSSTNCTRQINKMFYINSPPCSHELFKLFIISAIKQLN